jgi:hypothetical protein
MWDVVRVSKSGEPITISLIPPFGHSSNEQFERLRGLTVFWVTWGRAS